MYCSFVEKTKINKKRPGKTLLKKSDVIYTEILFSRTIGSVSEKEMGGSSGAMFSIFFEASASKLESAESVSPASVASALETGLFGKSIL